MQIRRGLHQDTEAQGSEHEFVVHHLVSKVDAEGRQDTQDMRQVWGQDNLRTVLDHVLTLSYVLKREQIVLILILAMADFATTLPILI